MQKSEIWIIVSDRKIRFRYNETNYDIDMGKVTEVDFLNTVDLLRRLTAPYGVSGAESPAAEAVCELFGGKKEDIKVIGIRHGEKIYETLLTNEECAKAEDMGNFYRVPADNRGLNYDKFFKEGETERNTLTEFNSNNTYILNVEEAKAKIAALDYIKKELSGEGNFIQ